MSKTVKRLSVGICILFFNVLLAFNTGYVYAEAPRDQNFDSVAAGSSTGTYQVGDLNFTTDTGIINVRGWDALSYEFGYGRTINGFSGMAISNDPDLNTSPTYFAFESTIQRTFKLESLYALITDVGSSTKVDIKGYNGSSERVHVDGIDFTKPGTTEYGDVTYTNNVCNSTDGEYGGFLFLGDSWYDINRVVITDTDTDQPLYISLDSLDFSNLTDLSIVDAPETTEGQNATFRVNLTKAYTNDITVDYSINPQTATADDLDTPVLSGTITIPANATYGEIAVPIKDDTDCEMAEDFKVTISNASVGGIIYGEATCTINDNDSPPKVTLSIDKSSIGENGGSAKITATLSNKTYENVTVNLDFTGAAAGTEYTASSTSILIPAGSLSNSIDISAVNNNYYSGVAKTLTVDINNVINGDKGAFDPTNLVITDDDSEPLVKLSVSGTSISENGSDKATLTATLSNMLFQDVTVNLAFSGTAKDTDFTAVDSIVIPAGTLSNSIDITGVDNTIFNSDKTLNIDISSVTNGLKGDPTAATVTIINDEAAPDLSINDITIDENSSVADFTVSLSNVCGEDVTVEYNTSDGTATIADGDYTASNGTLTIPAGESSAVISVPIINDGDLEGEENSHINILNPSIGVITKDTGMCTISDDESKPTATLSLGQNSISENGGTTTVTATLSNKSYQDVTVNLDFTGAAAGTEYTASSTSILIPAGSLSNSIDITAVNNNFYSGGDKTLTVDIDNVINGDKGVFDPPNLVITDDDSKPQVKLSVSGPSISENGSDKATLTATLSNTSYQDVTVNLAFSGTAKDTDFTAVDSIVIPAGSLSNSIDITGIDNTIFNSNKTLNVDISSVTNGLKGDPTAATVTIINDEAAADLSINDITIDENSSVADFTVSLSNVCGEDVTVEYNTSDETATIADGDYTASNGTLTIPAGESSAVISVPIINDGDFEGEENFHIDISNPSIGIVTKQQGVCTIEDNDLSVKIYGNGNEVTNGAAPLQTNGTVFDKPDVEGGTVKLEFTIENIGGSDLSGLQIELDNSDFSVTSAQAINLAAGASTTFAITFKQPKSETKPASATVTIKSDDSKISPFKFTIEGISSDSPNPPASTTPPTQVKETIDIDETTN